jgi:hypothetical protein
MTNRQIADVLVLSRHTVDAHLKHMFVKLDIHSRVQLTVMALRHFTPLGALGASGTTYPFTGCRRHPRAAAWRAEAD